MEMITRAYVKDITLRTWNKRRKKTENRLLISQLNKVVVNQVNKCFADVQYAMIINKYAYVPMKAVQCLNQIRQVYT